MEVMTGAGVVLRPIMKFSGTGVDTQISNSSRLVLSVDDGKKKVGKLCYRRPRNISSGFYDSGHFDYYASSKMKMKMKGKKEKSSEMKTAKTNLKMIKRLSRDLSMFSDVASVGQTGDSLIGEVKRKMMSEAMEFLHKQLQLMRKEQKELKKKNKKPKSKLGLSSSSSSSSSSESSDGECGEVTDMSHLTSSALKQSKAIQEATLPISGFTIEEVVRVEVCMGGKCKKLGARAVLEEFKKEVGAEGVVVVGCKCMGKCKNAPNVRFSNRHDGCNSSRKS